MLSKLLGDSLAVSSAAQNNATGRQRFLEQLNQRVPAYITAILGISVDGLAGYLFWSSHGSRTRLAMGILVHLLSGAWVGIFHWHSCRPTRRTQSLAIGILSIAFVPPIGAIVAAILLVKCALVEPGRKLPLNAFPPTVIGQQRKPPASNSLVQRGPGEPVIVARAVRPLVDLLKSDDMELKTAAVDMMVPREWTHQVGDQCKSLGSLEGELQVAADDFQQLIDTLQGDDLRLSVTKLRSLLEAPEADVRFRSSIGLLKLERHILESIAAIQFRVQQNPVPGREVYLLGLLYLTYARTKLVDEVTAAYYARLAISEFERCEGIDSSRSTCLERARCYLVCQDYLGCLTALANVPYSQETAELTLIKMEAMFALGRYQDIRQAGRTAAATLRFNDAAQYSLIRWWKEGT